MDQTPAPPPKVGVMLPEYRTFQEFLEPFQAETDRAAAILGAAMLDDILAEILGSFLVPSKISENLLTGPLESFSSRTDAAYALGFIDEAEHKELRILGQIRNKFAHSWRTLTFETDSIQVRVRNLVIRGPFGMPDGTQPSRQHFNFSVIAIFMALMFRHRSAGNERRSPPVVPR
jgi:mannitol operon repressor